jgi:hypothetical protein
MLVHPVRYTSLALFYRLNGYPARVTAGTGQAPRASSSQLSSGLPPVPAQAPRLPRGRHPRGPRHRCPPRGVAALALDGRALPRPNAPAAVCSRMALPSDAPPGPLATGARDAFRSPGAPRYITADDLAQFTPRPMLTPEQGAALDRADAAVWRRLGRTVVEGFGAGLLRRE